MKVFRSVRSATALCAAILPCVVHAGQTESRIPIRFTLDAPSLVTLVIENPDGTRVRNLISETPFPAGENVAWWDGLDDLARDPQAAKHGVYNIPGKPVLPGRYVVRGLVNPGLTVAYELTPYTNGKPPWRSADLGSQWLTNHSAPSDVLFLPPGKAPVREGRPTSAGGQVLVASKVAEGGSGLAWLDMNADKLWGQAWLGGVWTAASHLAVDRGTRPVPGVYAYAAASWKGDKYNGNIAELRLHKLLDANSRAQAPKDKRMGTGEDAAVLTPTYKIPAPTAEVARPAHRDEGPVEMSGLAAHDGLIVVSFKHLDHLLFVDAHKQATIGTASLADPRGATFDTVGRLYVISGTRLLRFDPAGSREAALPAPQVLIDSGLENPQYVCVDSSGNIYISDWGNSHQVKMFAGDGKFIRAFGRGGAPQVGPYDRRQMSHPSGMTVDDRGRLWLAENDKTPKRISTWNVETGELIKAYYGPSAYGGGGVLDPLDKTRFFYDDEGGATEFKLDWKTGESEPVSVYYRSDRDETGFQGRYTGTAPSYPLHHQGKTYLTNAYSGSTSGRRSVTIWRLDGGIAKCVASAGNTLDARGQLLPVFADPAMKAKMPEGTNAEKDSLLFIWSDLNNDGKPQADETAFRKPTGKLTGIGVGFVSVSDDLTLSIAYVGSVAMQFKPASYADAGVPLYDINAGRTLATDVQSQASSGGGQVLPASDGWVVTTTPPAPLARESVGGVKDGKPMWSYPSPWPGLHASHIAPMPTQPGELIGTTRVLGNAIRVGDPSDLGDIWAINGNKGNVYLLTVDGLFIQTLFEDSRNRSWDAPEAIPGMDVSHLSLQEECFGPTWTKNADGNVYMQAGFSGPILRLDGLNRVRRIELGAIDVTQQQLVAAQQWKLESEASRQAEAKGQAALAVPIAAAAPKVDGKLDDWNDATWAQIDQRLDKVGNFGKRPAITDAALRISGDRLYVALRTNDDKLLVNSGESLQNLFKTGGAIDLMFATDPKAKPDRRAAAAGDVRLLVAQVGKKTTAMLYRPVVPGAKGDGIEFASPLRSIRFDAVDDVSDQVELAVSSTADQNTKIVSARYELSVPLKTLGLRPSPGQSLGGDIGVLRGNGFSTLQRVYWSNKSSGLVSDIPSEAELIPRLWGTFQYGGSAR